MKEPTSLILERNLKLECYQVEMEFFVYTRHDITIAVLTHVAEHGNATVKSLADDLFAEHTAISQKYLRECVELELISEDSDGYRLTKKGEKMSRNWKMIKKNGIWRIYYAVDHLLHDTYKIIKIEPDSMQDYDEDEGYGEQFFHIRKFMAKIKNRYLIINYTQYIHNDIANSIQLYKVIRFIRKIKPDIKFRIRWTTDRNISIVSLITSRTIEVQNTTDDTKAYETLGVSSDDSYKTIKDKYKRLTLKYHPDKNKTRNTTEKFKKINKAWEHIKSGKKPKQKKSISTIDEVIHLHKIDARYSNLILELISHTNHEKEGNFTRKISKGDDYKWDYANDRLGIKFELTTFEERLAMIKTMRIKPSIKKYDAFDEVDVQIPIYPLKKSDASLWAKELLAEKMKNSRSAENYKKTAQSIKDMFSDFDIKFEDTDYSI